MSWQPIATAPSGRMLVVGWHQPDDTSSRWTGRTMAGALRWAAKQLAA